MLRRLSSGLLEWSLLGGKQGVSSLLTEKGWQPLVLFLAYPTEKSSRCMCVCQHFQTSSPLKPLGWLNPNFIWSLLGTGEQKFVQTVLVTWPRLPPCPYMVKTLKNLLLWNQRWPWNLVCSIGCSSSTKFVQMMTLGWPWPILQQGQIWSLMHLYGKKVKQWIFKNL